MQYLQQDLGMNREAAPAMPNQLTSDMYTSLNGDPQYTVNRQMMSQDQLGKVVTGSQQMKADAERTLNEEVRNASQKKYENQRFLNEYMTANLLEAGEAQELMALGMGNPEESLRILQASKQMAMGMNVDPLCC